MTTIATADCIMCSTFAGDRKFKLEFPWDGSKNLSLRANNTFMKRSWVELLKATLKEATLQIEGTGSVFAYGGECISLFCGTKRWRQ